MSWLSFVLLLLCWWPLAAGVILSVGAHHAGAACFSGYAFEVTSRAPNVFRALAIGAFLGVMHAAALLCLPLHPVLTPIGAAAAVVAAPTYAMDAFGALEGLFLELTGHRLGGWLAAAFSYVLNRYKLWSIVSVAFAGPWLSAAAMLRASS